MSYWISEKRRKGKTCRQESNQKAEIKLGEINTKMKDN